jgi:hypothetical protein
MILQKKIDGDMQFSDFPEIGRVSAKWLRNNNWNYPIEKKGNSS